MGDLAEQMKRIERAANAIARVPEYLQKHYHNTMGSLYMLHGDALRHNTVSGDYQSAEGCLENIWETVGVLMDRHDDLKSDPLP